MKQLTWEELIAQPLGTILLAVARANGISVELKLVCKDPDKVLMSFIQTGGPFTLTKENMVDNDRLEYWALKDETGKVNVPPPAPVKPVNSTYCTCNGPSKRADTGMSFSSVYYVCTRCRKEKQ